MGSEKAPLLPNGSMVVVDVGCIFRSCVYSKGFDLCSVTSLAMALSSAKWRLVVKGQTL